MNATAQLPAGARPQAYAQVSYRAFKVGEPDFSGQPGAYPSDIGEPETLSDALAAAITRGCFQHKATLAIRETGIRLRQWANTAEEVPFDRLHIYQIKRRSQPRYEGPFGERRVHDLYAELVVTVPGEVL
jgi:hypothetical protein